METEDPYLKTGYTLRTKKSSLISLKFSENISPQKKKQDIFLQNNITESKAFLNREHTKP